MDIIEIDKTIWDAIENPEKHEIEVCSTSLDILKDVSKHLYGLQKNIEARIMDEMEKEEATKLNFLNTKGDRKVLTLKPGPMKQGVENAEDVIKEEGFDPNEFGSYVYKLTSWSEMKEMQKLGGEVKNLVEKLYVRGKKTLTIGDKK